MTNTKEVPNRIAAALLGIFLGWLGLHKFYMRQYGTGTVMLLCTVFLSWTFIAPMIVSIVGFLQGISYLFWNEKDWAQRF